MQLAGRPRPGLRWREISVVLTDDAGAAGLCSLYFGRRETTDVLGFRFDPLPGDPPGRSGEIVVNVERALAPACRAPHWRPSRELALYLAHGCDHLMGAGDHNAPARARMRRRELRWLRRADREGLLADLI